MTVSKELADKLYKDCKKNILPLSKEKLDLIMESLVLPKKSIAKEDKVIYSLSNL